MIEPNLNIITDTDILHILDGLVGVKSVHISNGVYADDPAFGIDHKKLVPTVLAGFEICHDRTARTQSDILLVLNSDASYVDILKAKIKAGKATEQQLLERERPMERALKIACPLAWQHPDRKVTVIMFDEATPNRLFRDLERNGIDIEFLFKWGYGTDPKAGVVEGAEYAERTLGFPLPNDRRPIADELTRRGGQKGIVEVCDLRKILGPNGLPYISNGGLCTHQIRDGRLLQYVELVNPSANHGLSLKLRK